MHIQARIKSLVEERKRLLEENGGADGSGGSSSQHGTHGEPAGRQQDSK